MSIEAIFGLQFVLSLLVFALIARWYIAPWLSTYSSYSALVILLMPQIFRHIGMSFLVPGLVGDSLPTNFAGAAAYGDLASGLVALAAVFLLRMKSAVAIPVVWIFSIVGTVDLVNALRQVEVVPELGSTWYIPTFIVPALLVSQVMIFARLIRGTSASSEANLLHPSQSKAADIGHG